MKDAWLPVDPLGEALHFLRMRGAFYCRSEFTAPWGLALPPMPDTLMLHVVTAGRCVLEVDGAAPRDLQSGDLALVPHGRGHRLLSARGARAHDLFALPRVFAGDRYELLRLDGGGAATQLLCGAIRFDDASAQHLVRLLPPVLCVEASSAPQTDWMHSTLRLLAAEAQQVQPGGEAVITRLADILVIQALRAWMARDPVAQRGWLGALQDPQLGRAIASIHRAPARPWTLAALAKEAAMSRSAFAARFTSRVGEPAMQYVARWRMHLAHARLQQDDVGLAELAERMGYASEAAFSRAFKRFMGVSPGAVRKRAREADPPSPSGGGPGRGEARGPDVAPEDTPARRRLSAAPRRARR